MREVLAVRPMLVEQRQAAGGIGIQHLLRRDDLDLVGIDAQPEFGSRNLIARIVDALQRVKAPIRSFEQASRGRSHGTAFTCLGRRWKRSRKTGNISERLMTLRIDSGAPD